MFFGVTALLLYGVPLDDRIILFEIFFQAQIALKLHLNYGITNKCSFKIQTVITVITVAVITMKYLSPPESIPCLC